MKHSLLLLAGAVAVFAAGYWAGVARTRDARKESRSGPVALAVEPPGAGLKAPNAAAGAADIQVRAFQAGRPFQPGGAKAWLMAIAAKFGGADLDDFPVEAVELAQVFMTMDEASAREVADALTEIMAMMQADDPAFKGLRKHDELAEVGFVVAAFRLSQLNPQAALALLKGSPKGVPDELTKMIFARVASQNPGEAESMLANLEGEQHKDALEGVLYGLLGKDPAAALALAEKYPDEISRRDRDRILERMARTDPHQGITTAARISEAEKDSSALRRTFKEWLEHDQIAAMNWAGSYAGYGQLAVQAYLLEQQAGKDPEAAMQEFARLQQSAGDDTELGTAARLITDKLVEKDIGTAHAWASGLPEGQPRDMALSALASNWVRRDAGAASEWIASLPPGNVKDSAAGNLVDAIAKRDPSSAFEWARNIQNRDQRTHAMERVMNEWRDQDPDAAKAAHQSLPPELRDSIRVRD